MNLRSKSHSLELPQYQYQLFRKSFVPRSILRTNIVNLHTGLIRVSCFNNIILIVLFSACSEMDILFD